MIWIKVERLNDQYNYTLDKEALDIENYPWIAYMHTSYDSRRCMISSGCKTGKCEIKTFPSTDRKGLEALNHVINDDRIPDLDDP